jgi:hypothetical protein
MSCRSRCACWCLIQCARSRMKTIRSLIWLFLLATTASAQTFQSGDVVFVWQIPAFTGTELTHLDWYSGDGTLRRQTGPYSGGLHKLMFGADTRLYMTGESSVLVFNQAGDQTGRLNISASAGIARDRAGNLFVSGDRLYKIDGSGSVLHVFNAPNGFIDLAADQCTMLIVSLDRSIRRYDVCRDAPLPDLTTNLPGVEAFDVRILPDQSVLVAVGNTVARVAPDGSLIRTYSPAGVGSVALALATDGDSFWTGATDRGVFRVGLSDGGILAGPLPASEVWSIAVVDEPRAAIVGPSAVPTMMPIAFAALALVLLAIAFARLR